MIKPYTNYAWLRENAQSLHPFGLGFLQLKINDEERMHFWHPDFRREREEAHTHRYNFSSAIVVGSMEQTLYHWEPTPLTYGAEYEAYMTDCTPGNESSEPVTGNLFQTFIGTLLPDSCYTISYNTFHTIHAAECVTYLKRGPKLVDKAHVARKIGTSAPCPFAETMAEDQMWDMIKDLLERR